MANENKNINELVSPVDDDPTSEFQIPGPRRNAVLNGQQENETDERTFDVDRVAIDDDPEFDSIAAINHKLLQQAATIEQLQFELEKLRTKANGLECEVRAREEIAKNIRSEFVAVKKQLAHSRKALQERQLEIDFLQHSLTESGATTSQATAEAERIREETATEIDDCYKRLAEKDGMLASNTQDLRQLAAQVARTEKYADSLRIKLQSQQYSSQESSNSRHNLECSLKSARGQLAELRDQLAVERKQNERLTKQIEQQQAGFDKELRQVRFELGEAQETISCKDSMNEQLASDLIDNRGFRQVMESQLGELEEKSQQEIQKLERRLRSARQEVDEHERKIKAKDKAIAALMSELATLANAESATEEADSSVQDADSPGSTASGQRDGQPRNRVARLLIGFAGGRELRFPLFKDRLTIGRTTNNDIQLNVRYISRRHAVIVTDNDRTRLIDWGSKNGVYVNQQRVAEKFLKSGDIVTIGTTKFRYEERAKR